MKLTSDFLTSIPDLTYRFVDSSPATRGLFFHALMNLAKSDLALAHAVFKSSAVRTVLDLAEDAIADDVVGSFSVYKNFDTAQLRDGSLYGKKHWVTNASISDIAILQVMTTEGIVLCKTTVPEQREQFLISPGMMDTATYDLVYNGEPATILFAKSEEKYQMVSNHNTLCFIANHLGAVKGLLEYMKNRQDLQAEHVNLTTVFDNRIRESDKISNDAFWHKHNALYLNSKHLLVRTLQRIMEFEAGSFYNVNTQQGKYFFDCLTYSGHNGPIQRNYQQVFTESQDY